MTRGIIYSATGENYIEEAIVSAKSSLRYNDVPHVIFCDVARNDVSGVEFRSFEPSGNPFIDKIRNIRRSPFDYTIFLDTDTYVVGEITELFDLLVRFDVAAAHAPGYMKCDDNGQSEAFYDFNTGVLVYRDTDRVRDLLQRWDEIHSYWSTRPPFYLEGVDQPAFRRAIWESAASVYVIGPEYNYRSIMVGRLIGMAKVIHGRSTNYEKLAAHINGQTGMRTFLQFPPDSPW